VDSFIVGVGIASFRSSSFHSLIDFGLKYEFIYLFSKLLFFLFPFDFLFRELQSLQSSILLKLFGEQKIFIYWFGWFGLVCFVLNNFNFKQIKKKLVLFHL